MKYKVTSFLYMYALCCHRDGVVGGGPFAFSNNQKAFLAVPANEAQGANAFFFDGTTNIDIVPFESKEPRFVYTLSGIRIEGNKLPKGVYIVNGQKIIINK